MKYLSKRIKKDIIKGGLILAPRRSGKTVAILELLCESDDYVLICFSDEIAKSLISEICERGISPKKSKVKIKGPKSRIPYHKKVIIDECLWNPAFFRLKYDRIHCAISSPPLRTVQYTGKRRKSVIDFNETLV